MGNDIRLFDSRGFTPARDSLIGLHFDDPLGGAQIHARCPAVAGNKRKIYFMDQDLGDFHGMVVSWLRDHFDQTLRVGRFVCGHRNRRSALRSARGIGSHPVQHFEHQLHIVAHQRIRAKLDAKEHAGLIRG